VETIKSRVYAAIKEALYLNHSGLTYTQLTKILQERLPEVHPKTLNGYLWKFTLEVKGNKTDEFIYDGKVYRLKAK
jgi:hypothetical protein